MFSQTEKIEIRQFVVKLDLKSRWEQETNYLWKLHEIRKKICSKKSCVKIFQKSSLVNKKRTKSFLHCFFFFWTTPSLTKNFIGCQIFGSFKKRCPFQFLTNSHVKTPDTCKIYNANKVPRFIWFREDTLEY